MKTGACEEAASLFARTLVLKPDYAEASIHLRACEERLKLERTGPGVQGG